MPHWRADGVRYYVTFRHRRALEEWERALLLASLIRPDGRKWDLLIACVLPEVTELIFTVRKGRDGTPLEIADILEPAKRKTGSKIIKKTGERFPPFYTESFDRIIRDDAEFEERWQALVESPVTLELVSDPEDYSSLWVAGHSEFG